MGIISKIYIKQLVHRYDKEVGVPYFSYSDFKGLKQESSSFINSKRIEIRYFYYFYDGYKKDKVILFLHGIGPGHAAYLREIEELASRGYKVLTLDYEGCGESKGDILASLNRPTRDVVGLLKHLNLSEQLIVIGHSLGGYTALNVSYLCKNIKNTVVLSGFLSISSLIGVTTKSKFIIGRILKYERTKEPDYYGFNLVTYLKNAKNKILFIQSSDDPIVPYDIALKVVEDIKNENIQTIKVEGRKHNPNYTDDAANYLFEVFGEYNKLIEDKVIKTDNEKIKYFENVSLLRLTEQDKKLFDKIISFIEE